MKTNGLATPRRSQPSELLVRAEIAHLIRDEQVPERIQNLFRHAEMVGVPHRGPVPCGGTGYLDQFTVEDLTEAVSYGVDNFGRAFIALRVRQHGRGRAKRRAWVIHQRYIDSKTAWVVAGDWGQPLIYSNADELCAKLLRLIQWGKCDGWVREHRRVTLVDDMFAWVQEA